MRCFRLSLPLNAGVDYLRPWIRKIDTGMKQEYFLDLQYHTWYRIRRKLLFIVANETTSIRGVVFLLEVKVLCMWE
jgi:hypothetical protein